MLKIVYAENSEQFLRENSELSTNCGMSSFLKTCHQPVVVAPTVVIRTTCANRRHYFTHAAQQLSTISHTV